MRLIGHVTGETNAQLFSDYLSSLDIKSSVEPDSENKWAIWIYSEDQVDAGKQHFADYLAHPSDPKFAVGAKQGEKVQSKEREAEAKLGERVYTRETIFRSTAVFGGIGPVTLALIVICSGIFLYERFALRPLGIDLLLMSEHFDRSLIEVRQGQVWRLVTPILLHGGWLHLIFNMLMLKTLGTMVEEKEGVGKFLILVLVIALVSNLAQFYWTGPIFRGMSGVIYGLFGYIWMRWKFDPFSGYYVSPQTVSTMIIWFLFCMFQLIPGVVVANAAHAGGLVAGMAIGIVPGLLRR